MLEPHHAFLALLALVVLDLSVGKLGPNKTLAVFMCALKPARGVQGVVVLPVAGAEVRAGVAVLLRQG